MLCVYSAILILIIKLLLDFSLTKSSNICLYPGSQFWLFKGLSLQEGYPQPLSALRVGVHFTGTNTDTKEKETTAERWGLVWDPEEGPVWGNTEISEGAEENDTWTQLIRAGVNGIIKELDGNV